MNLLTITFEWVIEATLRASLVAIAVLALQRFMRHRLSSRWRYALWLPVLVALVVPSMPVLPGWMKPPVAERRAESPPAPVPARFTAMPQSLPMPPHLSIEVGAMPSDASAELPSVTPLPVAEAPAAPVAARFDWRAFLLAAWLVGTAAVSLFVLGSYALLMRRVRSLSLPVDRALVARIATLAADTGLSGPPRVLRSGAVASPAVCGLWRPTLLLNERFPQDLSDDEADMVLRHELTHIRRGDLLLNAPLCALLALHWFNPLLWLISLRVRADREAACDEQVLAGQSAVRRTVYGHALLKMETRYAPSRACLGFVGVLQRGSVLRERIQRIVSLHKVNPAMKTLFSLSIAVLAMAGVSGFADTQPKPVEAKPPAEIAADASAPDLAKATKVTAKEFKKQYASVGMPQTMHDISYLGRQDGKAFIRARSKSILNGRWTERVIYVPVDDLDQAFRDNLAKDEAIAKEKAEADKKRDPVSFVGRLVDDVTGSPVAEAELSFEEQIRPNHGPDNNLVSTASEVNGSFKLPRSSGHTFAKITINKKGYFPYVINLIPRSLAKQPPERREKQWQYFDVKSNAPPTQHIEQLPFDDVKGNVLDLGPIVLTQKCTLRGVLLDKDGKEASAPKGIAAVKVYMHDSLRKESRSLIMYEYIGSQESFSLELPPGKHDFILTDDDQRVTLFEKTITIEPGGKEQTIQIQVPTK